MGAQFLKVPRSIVLAAVGVFKNQAVFHECIKIVVQHD